MYSPIMETTLPIDEDRPTRAEIRLGALRRNFRRARELAGPGVKVMCAIKANAYGHGILRVAQELVAEGADYLGVAFLEEGMFLRRNEVAAPILVLGAIAGAQIPRFLEHQLDLTIPSVEKARAVSAVAAETGRRARVHLKIDTGMERIGVQWSSAAAFFDKVLALPELDIVGLFSHFATADRDLDFARVQLDRFRATLDIAKRAGLSPPLVHMASSAALVNLPESRFSMVRPGIVLYGYEPTPLAGIGFEPVMRLMSKVAYFKIVRANTGVSYGLTWVAPEDTRVVTIPIGYGDGYSRALSNRAVVMIGGRRYPVVGRICMDQLMVNLGPRGEAHNGDDVLLFGVKGEDRVDAELLCELLGTIPYELTSMISARVPRIYMEE